MNRLKVRGHYEHPVSRWSIAAQIDDPWHPGGFFLYRMPETFVVNDQRYIWQPRGALCWAGVPPEAAPEWSLAEDEAETGYKIRFYDGLELFAGVTAGDVDIKFSYRIVNGTDAAIRPSTDSCFMIWNAPHFIDRRHERTFVWAGGTARNVRKLTPTPEEMQRLSWVRVGVGNPLEEQELHDHCWPVREAVDHGLICVQSRDGLRSIGLAWPDANQLMARSSIPCLHSEPVYPSLEPGEGVSAVGKLYFSEDGISSILNRFLDDIESSSLHVRRFQP